MRDIISENSHTSLKRNSYPDCYLYLLINLMNKLIAQPLQQSLREKLFQSALIDTSVPVRPKRIRTPLTAAFPNTSLIDVSFTNAFTNAESPPAESLHYQQLTKRIWTVMQAGIERGFELQVLSLKGRTFRAEREGKGFIYKIYPGHFSFRSQYQDYDYEQTKAHKLALMETDGLAVPVSYGVFSTFSEMAEKFSAEHLPFPLVAKPNFGTLSDNVFSNLMTRSQLKNAADIIAASGQKIQLESHIAGRDYRVLIINHQYAGCVERRPANVTGDGQRSIFELWQRRNQEPERGDRDEAHTTIHQLVFDEVTHELLQQSGYTQDTVLAVGEVFYLQKKITASTGSDYIDCTEHLHKSIIKSCIALSYQFSTLTLGFDLITTDISKPLSETGGAFNEYNFLPYVDLHENCNIGQKRRVCRLIWDYIEANKARIVTPEFNVF